MAKKKTTKKTAAAKKVTKKATAKKTAAKKVTTKKAPTKKSSAKKATTKAKPAKPSAVKKPAPKKSTAKKAAPKKTAPKASTAKKASAAAASFSGPQVGTAAPAFTMNSDSAGTVKLADYKGKSNVLLYFYPKDDTPGCTVEACTFQKSHKSYEAANTVIIGVSPDSIESHGKFRKKYGLEFILASDPDHAVAEAYGVWVEKNNYGKKYMGVQRATFLIGKDGKVAAVWPKVKVEGHDEQVQQALASL